MHQTVPETIGNRVHAHVGEYPLGGVVVMHDAQRVVEAVPADELAEGLSDTERHEVTDDRQRRGRHVELGQPDPEGAAAIPGCAGQLVGGRALAMRISIRSINVPR